MAELTTNIAGIKFRNPVLTASGTFGFGEEFADLVDFSEIGGIITKGTTLLPREGNDYPRMAETAAGMLNCVGLQNGGVEHFCNDIYPRIKDYDTNIIVNVAGSSPETYAACAERLAPLDKIPAIELNISCPNVKQGGMAFGVTAEGAQSVVRAVRKAYPCNSEVVAQRYRHNRDSTRCGGRRSRRRVANKHTHGNVYRHRAPLLKIEHRYRRVVRAGGQARSGKNGLASGARC